MGKASGGKGKKKVGPFTVGELNRLIDGLCHPLFRKGEGYFVLDGVLHGLVEQDPPVSVQKFVK